MTRGHQVSASARWHERCPMLTIAPLLPDTGDTGPSHGCPRFWPLGNATASSRGGPPVQDHGWRPLQVARSPRFWLHPLGDTTASSRGRSSQDHGLRPCPRCLPRSVGAFVQANWPCTWARPCVVAAPQAFAVGLGIVPQTAGAQVLSASRLKSSGSAPACATIRLHRTTIRDLPRATIRVTRPARHSPPFALRSQRGAPHRSRCVASAALAAVRVVWPARHSPPFALRSQRGAPHRSRCVASAALAAVRVVRPARHPPPFALCGQRGTRRRSRCVASAAPAAARVVRPARHPPPLALCGQRGTRRCSRCAASAAPAAARVVRPARHPPPFALCSQRGAPTIRIAQLVYLQVWCD